MSAAARERIRQVARAVLGQEASELDFRRAVWAVFDTFRDSDEEPEDDPRPTCPTWLAELAEVCERCDYLLDMATGRALDAAIVAMARDE